MASAAVLESSVNPSAVGRSDQAGLARNGNTDDDDHAEVTMMITVAKDTEAFEAESEDEADCAPACRALYMSRIGAKST